jgi:hypothetical protein
MPLDLPVTGGIQWPAIFPMRAARWAVACPLPANFIFPLKYPQGPPIEELFDEIKLSVWFTDKNLLK